MEETERRPTAAQPRITTCDPPLGFSPGIGRYVAQLAETRDALLSPVENLTPEQLSWHPNPETESIGTLLLHVAAIEWSWVFQEIDRRPDEDYDGWEEALPLRVGLPQVRDRPLSYFTDRLDRVRDEVLARLRELTDEDLSRLVADSSTPESEPATELYSIDWVLFHLVHHEAHHAGQVELLVRLLPKT